MKIKNIYILSICLLAMWSCDDRLNIEPAQSLPVDVAVGNEANIKAILVGAYAESGEDDTYGGQIQVMTDLLGATDQVSWQGTFVQPRQYFTKGILVDNLWTEQMWRNHYETINQVNLVIDNLSIISDAAEATRVEGEARFLRALSYFDLVRHFGLSWVAGGTNDTPERGVPLRLEGILDYTTADLSIARSTVADVYTQVITDLTAAMGMLPADNGDFADSFAAEALLARVYLQQGNYPGARDAAHNVITNSGHAMAASFAAAFNNETDGSEDVFTFKVTNQTGENDLTNYYAHESLGGRGGDIAVAAGYAARFDDAANDERASFTYVSDQNGLDLTSKYVNEFANIPMIRLAEMHLIRAEANFREGTSIGEAPLADINNNIRARLSAAPLAGPITLAMILNERQLELAFEGFLVHDMKRTGTAVGTIAADDLSLVSPIPQDELDTNPLIQPTH
ncbi:MAG: RagB/SusD family nutrient uptake outer membrane protein [Cyclobacteriaceae bacterium]